MQTRSGLASFLVLAGMGLLVAPGCSSGSRFALALAKRSGGPTVRFDPESTPYPDIPFPNDVATRPDLSSPTGRRVYVGGTPATQHERRLRQRLRSLDGFGVYAPITVGFDGPLDLEKLRAAHADASFANDAVLLINVDETCSRFGEEVALDVGGRFFPAVLPRTGQRDEAPGLPSRNLLFDNDPHADAQNLLFEENNEDVNGNRILDPGEDIDGDGVLDIANLDEPRVCDLTDEGSLERARCIADHLMTYYERETDTLVLRPLWPLEERCRHAVVLTARLVGENGKAVESPFPQVHAPGQEAALRPLRRLLPRYGLSTDDVAFAWSFTTGTTTRALEAIRAGLYGQGAFARLATEFPIADVTFETPREELGSRGALASGACSALASTWYAAKVSKAPNVCAQAAANASLGGVVHGQFRAPYFLADKDRSTTPGSPADEDEVWNVDVSGAATYGAAAVPFVCAVPRRREEGCTPGNPEGQPFCPPFPTVLFLHEADDGRAALTDVWGQVTSFGLAACAFDGPGQGRSRALRDAAGPLASFAGLGLGGYPELLLPGRDRDLDGDGAPDPGADTWTADLFHTRDVIRQNVVEALQLVRILRGFDGKAKDARGAVLGDFDGDGAPDIGGPNGVLSAWGNGFGGMLAGILAGAEPSLDVVVAGAAGAGLSDVVARSDKPGLAEAVLLPMAGPFLAGFVTEEPVKVGDGTVLPGPSLPDGTTALAFLVADGARATRVEIGRVRGLLPGDRVEVTNTVNGTRTAGVVDGRGTFRVPVAADALTVLERRRVLGIADAPPSGPVRAEDTKRLGDTLVARFFDGATGKPKSVVDAATEETLTEVATFRADAVFQGTWYPNGAPLVAVQRGLGLDRNGPALRQHLGIAQMVWDAADPAAYLARYAVDPLRAPYDATARPGRTHLLVLPTAGDTFVPVSTGVAMARIAGILGSWRRDPGLLAEQGYRELFGADPRFGHTADERLRDTFVTEGVSRLERYATVPIFPGAVFDVDDVSEGRARFRCNELRAGTCRGGAPSGEAIEPPTPAPGQALRRTVKRGDGTFDALRIAYLDPSGTAGPRSPQPQRSFDGDTFVVNFTLRYLASRGRALELVRCAECSAGAVPSLQLFGQDVQFAPNGSCSAADVKVCDPVCAGALGMRTPAGPLSCP